MLWWCRCWGAGVGIVVSVLAVVVGCVVVVLVLVFGCRCWDGGVGGGSGVGVVGVAMVGLVSVVLGGKIKRTAWQGIAGKEGEYRRRSEGGEGGQG